MAGARSHRLPGTPGHFQRFKPVQQLSAVRNSGSRSAGIGNGSPPRRKIAYAGRAMKPPGSPPRWTVVVTLLAALAAVSYRARSEALTQAAAQGRAEPVTVLVTFGTGATADQRWDGSVEVRGGELVRLEPWHFSPEDALTGPVS